MSNDVLYLCVLTVLAYIGFRIVRAIHRVFSRYFVLWKVARGATEKNRSISAKDRLLIFVCPTDYLDDSCVSELHTFLGKLVNSNLDIQGFHKLLLSYNYAALYRDKRDGSLRGMSLINITNKELDKKSYIVMEVGACYYEKQYRGSLCMHYVLAYFRLKALFCHPFTPFLLVGQIFGYKSYALMTHTFNHVYPCYHSKTPDHMRQFINDYAMKNRLDGDFYDPETFVVKKENYFFLKDAVAEVKAADTKDLNIEFFVKQNPKWAEGYQLVTVASLGVFDILCLLYRMLIKLLKGGKSQKLKKPKLLRRHTYQNDYANQSAWKIFQECDLAEQFHPSLTEEDDMADFDL